MFVRLLFFISFFYITVFQVLASHRELENIRKDLERDLSHLRYVFGLDIKSSSQRRGATLYQHPDINPSFHLHFASEREDGKSAASSSEKILSFLRPELHFSFISASASFSITRYARIESGIQFFDGGEFFRTIKNRIQNKQKRPLSIEAFTGLESQIFSWFMMGTQIEKDLKAHHGFHASLYNRIRVYQWFQQNRDVLNIFIGGDLGFADAAHNHYLFGPSASSGLSHYGFGIDLEWPKIFWDMQLGTNIFYSGLLGKNRNLDSVEHADYLTGILKIQRSFR
ncbi:MAG: hypothetical protein J0L93_09255 [Deltaproteobacteria bacterium]|nr:hypothetical protein [Deltaproteobacteria bacterium]